MKPKNTICLWFDKDALEAAKFYAGLGYPVFPCHPGGKAPLTEHGFHDASTDPDQIDAWWRQWPSANVAMATAGTVVIDIDGADNPWPVEPDQKLDLAGAPQARTPRGGRHVVFRPPAVSTQAVPASLSPSPPLVLRI